MTLTLAARIAVTETLVLPLVFVSCTNSAEPQPEPDTPTLHEVSGTYQAITFTTQEGSVVTDQLARGSSLDLVLTESLATTGQLFVPGGAEDGSDFSADLAGTWVLRRDTVTFAHSADTFVRDMAFVFANDRLSGEESFGGTLVRVVLTKE